MVEVSKIFFFFQSDKYGGKFGGTQSKDNVTRIYKCNSTICYIITVIFITNFIIIIKHTYVSLGKTLSSCFYPK